VANQVVEKSIAKASSVTIPEPIPVDSFKDLVTKVEELKNPHWVFRGHGRVNWRIESSLI
jgi:hypothetical protein